MGIRYSTIGPVTRMRRYSGCTPAASHLPQRSAFGHWKHLPVVVLRLLSRCWRVDFRFCPPLIRPPPQSPSPSEPKRWLPFILCRWLCCCCCCAALPGLCISRICSRPDSATEFDASLSCRPRGACPGCFCCWKSTPPALAEWGPAGDWKGNRC